MDKRIFAGVPPVCVPADNRLDRLTMTMLFTVGKMNAQISSLFIRGDAFHSSCQSVNSHSTRATKWLFDNQMDLQAMLCELN